MKELKNRIIGKILSIIGKGLLGGQLCTLEFSIGLDRLCWHNFEHNRQLKELRIMLA